MSNDVQDALDALMSQLSEKEQRQCLMRYLGKIYGINLTKAVFASVAFKDGNQQLNEKILSMSKLSHEDLKRLSKACCNRMGVIHNEYRHSTGS